MKANPTTFYEPQNRVLFDETTAEILTGATTYHALPKEKQDQLKKEFSERVLDYFDELNIAPTLDNLLLHQSALRKEITFQIDEEIAIENEEFLGLGKKAKAKREAKKSNSNSDTWNTGGSWNKENKTTNPNSVASAFGKPQKGWDKNRTGTGTTNPQWANTLTNILGASTQVVGAIQAAKQNNQQVEQQQQFFPSPEPKKPKVLGLEPVVGIAVIILILAVFGFLIWQISQNNSK